MNKNFIKPNIVDVASAYLDLKPAGQGKWKSICPFHEESNPSLYIWENHGDDGRFQCFGCGEKGDVIDFLMKIENITFPEVLHRLEENGFVVGVTNLKSSPKSQVSEIPKEATKAKEEGILRERISLMEIAIDSIEELNKTYQSIDDIPIHLEYFKTYLMLEKSKTKLEEVYHGKGNQKNREW